MTFYKTLFARMGNIKAGKYTSDEGEDLNDTEKVLKKNGILLRNSTNEFRDFGDVLDEVAGKWENYDNVTQHAIATAFAGTRQQEKFFVLMENYGKALEYEAVAAESAGTANQKYTDAYLNSIEARKNAMKAAFESLSQTILDSEVVKVFYSMLTGVITAIDKLISSGVGAVVVVELLYAIFMKLAKALVTGTGVFTSFNAALFNATGLTWAESVANVGLWGTIKAVTKALWEQAAAWIAAGGWIAIVIAAIAALIVILSKASKSAENAKQKNKEYLEELRREISDTTSELDSLESKLEDVRKRIAEIKNNPLKNIADMNELQRLETELSRLEDRLTRAEEKNKRLKEEEYKTFVKSTEFANRMNLAPGANAYSQSDENTNNAIMLLSYVSRIRNGHATPEDIKDDRFYKDIAGWIDDLSTLLGDLSYIDNPTNELERTVNERIQRIYELFDEWDYIFSPDGLFDRILNRPYYSDARSVLGGIVSPEDLQTLYGTNNQVKAFVDYIAKLYGLNLDDGGFTYIFNSLRSISASSKNVAKNIEELYDTLTGAKLKDATDAVSALADAIEEMDGAGKISLETAIKLAELGEQYVQTITIENGQIKVNTDYLRELAIQKLNVAKATAVGNGATEETIALYDKLIEDAKMLGASDLLTRANSLLDYENTIFEFIGGEKGDLSRLRNINEQRVNVLYQIKYYREKGYSSDSEEILSLYQQYIKYSDQMVKINEELISQGEDELKESIEKENEALEEQKKLYDDIINARKKALDALKDEANYQKDLAAKQKKVSDLQTQLAAARLDTSASGRARVRQLEEQLTEAQEDLDEFNLEHAVDIISEQLEAEQEENERIYEQQKADNDARLDKFIESNENLIDNYKQYLVEALENVTPDLDKEGGVISHLGAIQDALDEIEEKIGQDNVHVSDPPIQNLTIDQITERKIARHKKYHSGGIVADLSLGDNEVFAKLMKGEYVATPAQMSSFLRKTLPNMTGIGGSQQFNAPLITVTCGSVTEESLPKLESIVKSAADKIKSELTSAFDKTGFRSTNKRILAY